MEIQESKVFTLTIKEVVEAITQYVEKKSKEEIPEYDANASSLNISPDAKIIKCTVVFGKMKKKKQADIVQINKPNKDNN